MRLSTRLLLVIATCLVPIIVFQAVVSWSQWNERKTQLDALAVHQAELLAGDVASITEGARILLSSAAEFHQVKILAEACNARLASLREKVPSFAFIVLIDAQGRLRCASDSTVVNAAAGSNWIKDALAASEFTAGHFARSTGVPGGVLPFFLPLRDAASGDRRTLIAALDLNWLAQHLMQLKQGSSNLLPGGVLTVADAHGVVLARNPRHSEFVGQQFPAAAMPIVHQRNPGRLQLTSIDGTERMVGYIPPTPASHNLASAVGFYGPDLMGDINRALFRSALLLGIATLVAFLLTLFVARRFIARPTDELLAATRNWREGDLAVRVSGDDRHSEFGQIAEACNEMAAALSRREDELREHAESLEARVAERTQELLVTNNRLQVEIAERQNTEAALVQSQKLQAVGQLAGGIAHDFNNLLAAIQGSLDLLERSIPKSQERQHAWIERASGSVLRGSQLTKRLLAFSRRRRLAVEATEVNRLVSEMVALLGVATLGNRIRIETDLAADLWPAMAEPSQVEAALLNLALNARDAMVDGGLLTITTANETLRAPAQELPAGDYVAITVTDTGVGMTEEVARRALEPFFTTKGSSGSGLGLSQVHAMVQESNGTIRIRTAPGEGTSVSLLLPRAARVDAPVGPVIPARREDRQRTAFVIDDDPEVLEVTADMLRQLGYNVSPATGGQQALDLLQQAEAAPSLVLLDYAMPGMNGLALAGALRQRGYTGPIIMATGYADLSNAGSDLLGELHGVLNKPYTFQELEAMLSEIEDGEATETARSSMQTTH